MKKLVMKRDIVRCCVGNTDIVNVHDSAMSYHRHLYIPMRCRRRFLVPCLACTARLQQTSLRLVARGQGAPILVLSSNSAITAKENHISKRLLLGTKKNRRCLAIHKGFHRLYGCSLAKTCTIFLTSSTPRPRVGDMDPKTGPRRIQGNSKKDSGSLSIHGDTSLAVPVHRAAGNLKHGAIVDEQRQDQHDDWHLQLRNLSAEMGPAASCPQPIIWILRFIKILPLQRAGSSHATHAAPLWG